MLRLPVAGRSAARPPAFHEEYMRLKLSALAFAGVAAVSASSALALEIDILTRQPMMPGRTRAATPARATPARAAQRPAPAPAPAPAAVTTTASAGNPLSALFGEPLAAPAPARTQDGRPKASAIKRETVSYSGPHSPGTIMISTAERRLYLVLPGGQALKYGVGVGRPGFEWGGQKSITMKREWPGWTPPPEMRKRRPDLPLHMEGGLANPLGARAMYLGSSLYRIHGSNEPETIGQAVSSGCIRMTNEDVIDLYDRVKVGTRVVVVR
jgi:lipoprotein-anchoring transpeptidase ErfK/SrfK